MNKQHNDLEFVATRINLGSQYSVKKLLGSGGICDVYEGHDNTLNIDVALKILKPEFIGTEKKEIIEKILIRETKILINLNHKNIIRVYNFVEGQGPPFISMELLEGHTLEIAIQKKTKYNEIEMKYIMEQICNGLIEVHKRDIIHMDLKPENIMLTKKGTVKIFDFGMAKIIGAGIKEKTEAGGTLYYASPEVLNNEKYDKRSDIYSLGCIMYKMLTGDVPFTGNDILKVKYNQKNSRPSEIDSINKNLRTLVLKCLEYSPENRFQSVEELKYNLLNYPEEIKISSEGEINKAADSVEDIANEEEKKQKVEISQELKRKINRILKKRKKYEPELVFIPSGEFIMGSNKRYVDETPVRKVRIKNFFIGKYPITFKEYDFFCKKTKSRYPSDFGYGRGNRPVIDVSWTEAKEYIEWLNSMTKKQYRLPSEAEWEFVAKSNKNYKFPTKNNLMNRELANYNSNVGKTTPVGTYPANYFGVYDMAGNVWEWLEDDYCDNYKNASSDGKPHINNGNTKVIRGGSYTSEEECLVTSYRECKPIFERTSFIGFRLALSL